MKVFVTVLAAAAVVAACSTSETAGEIQTTEISTMPMQTNDGTLVGLNGHTLYVFSRDVAGSGQSVCVGTCAKKWPPLVARSNAVPQGDYSIITRNDGSRQWAYKGLPLYYFAKDVKDSDKLGDGVGGLWRVARP